LTESGLVRSSSGSWRSTYCFRHTYATFRLSEGVDVYFLAKQMGTSVKMIEDHYGHINPVKNAERILQGLPGWEPIAAAPQVVAETGRVKAGAAKGPSRPVEGCAGHQVPKESPYRADM
jgi:integrase